jgi:hypothetical protein
MTLITLITLPPRRGPPGVAEVLHVALVDLRPRADYRLQTRRHVLFSRLSSRAARGVW